MDFRVLGPLEVSDGGNALALGGPKKRAVLAILVVHANSVVSADHLIDEVWGEEAPKSARRTLHSYVANLRKTLNVHGEILSGRQGGYILEVDPSSVDVVRFAQNVDEARSLHVTDPTGAMRLLDEAFAMWRGPPFGSLTDDVPSLRIESARLEELRLTAVELRIDCEFEIGHGDSTIGDLECLVAEHPYREGLWHRLMLALYRSGRQGEALGAYQRVRKILGEELGIEPSRGLAQLEEQIQPARRARGPRVVPPGPRRASRSSKSRSSSRTQPSTATRPRQRRRRARPCSNTPEISRRPFSQETASPWRPHTARSSAGKAHWTVSIASWTTRSGVGANPSLSPVRPEPARRPSSPSLPGAPRLLIPDWSSPAVPVRG